MLVSALLTSVGINSALCVLFFVLYSILRKQPNNYQVYAPRLLAEGISKRTNRFNLERLIPSAGWMSKAWKLSEEDMLSSSGLDAVVCMRVITFCLKVFSFAGIIGIFILLPVNCLGTELHQIDFADLYSYSLDVFTISNVNRGSKWLWIHFSAVYFVTIFVCGLLYYEYKYISSKRIAYFFSSKPQPHQFTILVRNIPVSAGLSVGDSVESFFKEYHPTTYLSHIVVRRTSKLRSLINEAKQLSKRLLHLQSEPSERKQKLVGLFGEKIDLLDDYGKRLEDIEQNVRLEQSEVSMAEDTRAAFVSFKSRYGASIAVHLQQSINPTHWLTEEAPEPNDVAFVSQIVTGYLPSLILQLFLKAVPPILEFLSSIQGYISHSEIEKSACNKVLWFTIWNIFFATVFSGTLLYQFSIFLDPKNIPAKLAVAVPAQASFFVAYVVTSGWTSISSELFRVIPLICSLRTRCFAKSTDDEIEVPSIPYHRDLPRILLFGLLGITYFFLAPLILPFLLVYLCLAYIIFRNQFINVYAPKYETAGKFWPIVHNSMIFSLVLMHAIAVGIFTLKKLPLASTLIFPLPVLTLLFNEYCRKRFLPIFIAYSAEVLIKKDMEDHNDAMMSEFFDKLVTAYQDPALMPIQFSGNSESLNRPLISPADV